MGMRYSSYRIDQVVDVVFGSVKSANEFLGCFESCKSVFLCVAVLECSHGLVYFVHETVHLVVLVGAVFIGAIGSTISGTIGSTICMSAVSMSTV